MAHGNEEKSWNNDLRWFAEQPAYRTLRGDGRWFVDRLAELFGVAARTASRRSAGNHAVGANAFQTVIEELLARRGINCDHPKCRIQIGPTTKTADVTFRHRSRLWAIEIKTGLEFNPLAAAVVEALAYKRKFRGCRFVLVSAYAKFDHAADVDPAATARDILRGCGLPRAVDDIHVLARMQNDKGMDDDRWAREFAVRVKAFCAALPTR